ncbi:MAG: hypothetical protein GDA38_27525 [Hormoscilla sp. SP12CHS1]|nr:hypothetical protein [Hormoscilla sp. SP12CHS1]
MRQLAIGHGIIMRKLERIIGGMTNVSIPELSERFYSVSRRHADLINVYCYEFTKGELEEFEANSKAVPLPREVHPYKIAEVHCYDFTSDENQPDVVECK